MSESHYTITPLKVLIKQKALELFNKYPRVVARLNNSNGGSVTRVFDSFHSLSESLESDTRVSGTMSRDIQSLKLLIYSLSIYGSCRFSGVNENPTLVISYKDDLEQWQALQPPPQPIVFDLLAQKTKRTVAEIQRELNVRISQCVSSGQNTRISLYVGEDQRPVQSMDIPGLSDTSIKLTKKDPLSIVAVDKDTGIIRIMALGLGDGKSSIYLTSEYVGGVEPQVKKYLFTKSSNYSL